MNISFDLKLSTHACAYSSLQLNHIFIQSFYLHNINFLPLPIWNCYFGNKEEVFRFSKYRQGPYGLFRHKSHHLPKEGFLNLYLSVSKRNWPHNQDVIAWISILNMGNKQTKKVEDCTKCKMLLSRNHEKHNKQQMFTLAIWGYRMGKKVKTRTPKHTKHNLY